uniref:E3 ubiquitin-protein ligase SINA-like 7 n=1 Tax=Erigeron canadensis TaxID=72917 RepID=UPI001CB8BE3D|nr:E3 ubiquitin-protein ligase SINA-like 7 [Erigeron canadensis]
MARFSIGDEDEDAPLTYKRARCSEPPSQSNRVIDTAEVDNDDDEDFAVTFDAHELTTVDDVESDSGDEELEEVDEDGSDGDEEEEEEDEDDDDENDDDVDEVPPVSTARQINCLPPVSRPVTETVFNNTNGALQVVLTDPDVLDCPICLDPLSAPVFQCENGHIACSLCCSKINRKCPSCCMPIGYNRCRAIEKVIESVRISCKNAQYGCKENMTYSKKNEHEIICPHAPCFCPHPSCPFTGSSKNLYLHFRVKHAASTTRFTYNTTFTLRVESNQKHVFLQEQHESVIFILNHEVREQGRAFNVDCVGPSTLKTSLEYHLTTKNDEATLSLQCAPQIYAKWSEHKPAKNYIIVPSDFSHCNGVLSLDVCIRKTL